MQHRGGEDEGGHAADDGAGVVDDAAQGGGEDGGGAALGQSREPRPQLVQRPGRVGTRNQPNRAATGMAATQNDEVDTVRLAPSLREIWSNSGVRPSLPIRS